MIRYWLTYAAFDSCQKLYIGPNYYLSKLNIYIPLMFWPFACRAPKPVLTSHSTHNTPPVFPAMFGLCNKTNRTILRFVIPIFSLFFRPFWFFFGFCATVTFWWIKIYAVSKTSPTFSIVTWRKNYPILKILAWIFLTPLAIKWLFTFPPHPMSAFALPRESRPSEICVKIYKNVTKHPEYYWSWLEKKLINFSKILIIFDTNNYDTSGY